MKIKRNTREPFVAILLALIMLLSVFSAMCTSASAATEEEIQEAIDNGVVWLVAQQNNNTLDPNNGSWDAYYGQLGAGTGLALYKLEDRAYELGYDSPFDPDYEYHQNVEDGLNWTFANLAVVDINDQNHTTGATGTVDDPDTNGNGIGVCSSDPYPYKTYSTGILLTAISASGTPDRVVNVPGSPVDGWTYKNVSQDMVDYLAFGQVESPVPNIVWEGGWDYAAVNNGSGVSGWHGDQSNTGYVVLGLAEAESFGCTVPDWVKTELNAYIDLVQDDVDGDTNDGGSWYSNPQDIIGVNILKTGNLISEMAFVGDAPNAPRVTNATDYLVRHWNDTSGINNPAGWNGTPAQYQTMFTTMKGLEYMGIDTFDGTDWFEDISDVIVAQQNKTAGPTNGSWQTSSGRGEPVIITIWALLTLEKVAPPPPPKGSITGMKFEDLNANGTKDVGEAVLEGWTITLTNESGVVVQTTMTNESGHYEFTDLDDGTYIVGEDIQDGWVQTIPDAPGTYEIMIEGGNDHEEINFGNFKKGKITAGGWIPAPNEPKATFGLVGQYPGNKDMPKGNVEYQDHVAGLNIKSIQINTVATTMDKTKGVITGLAQVNGEGAYPFMAYVEDNGEPGKGTDVFMINLPTYPYSNGDILGFGNVQIHK